MCDVCTGAEFCFHHCLSAESCLLVTWMCTVKEISFKLTQDGESFMDVFTDAGWIPLCAADGLNVNIYDAEVKGPISAHLKCKGQRMWQILYLFTFCTLIVQENDYQHNYWIIETVVFVSGASWFSADDLNSQFARWCCWSVSIVHVQYDGLDKQLWHIWKCWVLMV